MPLKTITIQNLRPKAKPYRIADGMGLWLEVRPSGGKFWRYRYKIEGKENIFTIGEFLQPADPNHLSLEAARRALDEAKALVRTGKHPTLERRNSIRKQIRQNKNTFKAIAEEWIARKEKNWAPKTAEQIKTVFKGDIYPAIGQRPITDINPQDILEIITAVDERGANTFAILIRQWVSAVFRFAIVTLRASTDPAAPLKDAIERNRTKHSKSLSRDQLKQLLRAINNYGGDPMTVFALDLILLTFVRTIELRGARWKEFDFKKAEWRIPPERMKMRIEHVVPLSRQALAILKSLYVVTGHRELVFPNRRDPQRSITPTTINRALERMGFLGEGSIGFSAHGFRSTASTMLNEAGFRSDVVERQLAHQDSNKVRASYNHAQYMDERRVMMQVWADMIDELAADTPNHALTFVQKLTFQPT